MPRRHLNYPKIYVIATSLAVAVLLSIGLSFIFKKILAETAYFTSRRTIASLQSENRNLKQDVLKLLNELSYRQNMVQENKELKKMLNLKEQAPQAFIPATIIRKNPWTAAMEILIDKGKIDGVTKGSLVIDFESNLVGKIEKADIRQSWLRLVSDPNFKVISRCNGLNAILVGALFEGAKLLYVPYDFAIQDDDPVLIPAASGKGITIKVGQVSFVKKIRSSLTQSVFIKPSADLNGLSEVFVVKGR
ncbi:rod shape-determining protein MreC [Candidatus Omnitrophota bacterium]